jgi:DNA-binding SARP family transcriptional activator
MDTQWRIEMLGCLRATQGGTTGRREGVRVIARFRTRKAAALLAYLAYHPHRAHPRELLIELLWPEYPPENGHNNLSRELTSLRRQLEPRPADGRLSMVDGAAKTDSSIPSTINHRPSAIILADRHTVQLSPAAVSGDVAAFEAALQAAARAGRGPERLRWLAAAVELYRGELLPGSFDAWVVPERLRLEEAFLGAMHELVEAREEGGDQSGALLLAWRAAAVDPLREETHADLVRLLVATGQREAALRQCREQERFLELEHYDRGKPSLEIRSSTRDRMAQRRLQVQAAEAEELRRQLALRTAEAEALRQRLRNEMAETRRLRQVLAAGSSEAEAPGRQPRERLAGAGVTRW